ncbi:MAG: Trm112 family protein [Candidatus Omnitrophica bacterium]|nr:Trm112 family protein [Candidatus Omnitrophota bacterium]
MEPMDPKLLEILACPACKTKVVLECERLVCTNSDCRLQFIIRDGIPVMLIEEALKPPL